MSLQSESKHSVVRDRYSAEDKETQSSAPSPQSSFNRQYWRSLEELAETKEFAELLHREFPHSASVWPDPVSRRRFLQVMGASLVLTGLGAEPEPSARTLPVAQVSLMSILDL